MKKTYRSRGKITKAMARRGVKEAAEAVREIWLKNPVWPPDDRLERALRRLVDARADIYIAEWGLRKCRVRPFFGGWLLIPPEDKYGAEAGSVVVSLPLLGIGERIKAIPEGLKPVLVEVVALSESAVPPAAESLLGPYEDGDLLNAYFFAVVDGKWACMDIERFLRITAEEVLEAGGPLKAYREGYGELDDLRILRFYKKCVELYEKGVI
ncbi:MAG: hypothetical protein ACPLTR_08460 [Thermacetogeniaceae bacterium]